MMRNIKVAFVDFWNCDFENFFIIKNLRRRYDVEIVNDVNDAEYVIFSVFGDNHYFVPEEKIKIFYTGENICPDFNTCDYAFGFEWLDYGDRYMRLPNIYATPFFQNKQRKFEGRYIEDKKNGGGDNKLIDRKFCSFVVSNSDANSIRGQLFDLLSNYKTVDSGGRWKNNVGGPIADKLVFENQHKFSICCENSSHPGYTTEKIIEAFAARVIPIYWGDPEICKVFNSKSFINVLDYPSLDAVVEKVKYLDNNDKAYLAMLNEPALIYPDEYSLDVKMQEVESFLANIIEQPKGCAFRYNREYWGKKYIGRHKYLIERSNKGWKELFLEGLKTKF